MDKDVLNIALIGAGRWGKNIIRTIQEFDSVNLCCVASRNNSINDLIPNNCKVYSDWGPILQHPNLDGIIVATPPHTHYEITKSCLLMGINVLVEKPLTLDLNEAINLKNLAIQSKTLLMTEFTQVFNPKFQKLKKSLSFIGKLNSVITEAGNFGPYRKNTPVLWDWGSHELSILLSLINSKPKFIQANLINDETDADGNKSSWDIYCEFNEKIKSKSTISNITNKKRRVGVFGEKGMILLDDINKNTLQFYEGWHEEVFPKKDGHSIKISNQNEPLFEALMSFFQHITNKDLHHWSLDLGIEVTRLLSICEKN